MLVLPFSNSTHQPGLEWISEAFPEILGQRLDTESLFLISRDDRQYAFDRMGIPVNLRASRATLYQIATQLDADYIILGGYSFDGQIFTAHAQVMNGASDLSFAVLGDAGRHARSTIGVPSLPMDASVEVEGMFEIA